VAAPDLKRVVEALLFAADAPVPLDRLVEIIGDSSRGDVREAINELSNEYDSAERPFAVTEVAGGWQLYCRPDYLKWVRELHRGRMPTRLSQAALETLAIIAYKQPIVRAEVEIIRGVDASGVLATLLRRNLIAIAGRAPGMGRALMYRTTREFLRYFGLNTITDLPRLEEFAEVLGLKPDELELAIEGAESLAGVSAAEQDDADGARVDEPEAEAGEPEEAGDAPEPEEPEGSEAHGDVPGPTEETAEPAPAYERVEAGDDAAESGRADAGDEGEPEHAAIVVPGRSSDQTPDPPQFLPGPDSGQHPTPDRKIIDSTDET
jgi:segregation and condensation protein B